MGGVRESHQDFHSMHFGLARDTATDPIICSEDEAMEPPDADDEGLAAAIAAADAEDGLNLGGDMDDDSDAAPAASSSSAAPAASSSSAQAPKVAIKQEPCEDNVFVKRLRCGEKVVIDLD